MTADVKSRLIYVRSSAAPGDAGQTGTPAGGAAPAALPGWRRAPPPDARAKGDPLRFLPRFAESRKEVSG